MPDASVGMASCCRCAGSRSRWPDGSSSRTSSFTVRARDKIGLVGRNGAGKTSLLRVLGGARCRRMRASSITAARSATCRRTRSSTPSPTTSPALTHVLSGRGLDDAMVRLEKLRLRLEEDTSDANVARYARAARPVRARRRLRGRVGGPQPRRRPRPRPRSSRPAHRRAVGRRAPQGRARPHPVRRQRPAAARRADQPPRQRRRDWLLGFLREVPRRARRRQPRPRPPRRGDHRVLHLDRSGDDDVGTLVEYKGTYSQYLSARRKDEERLAKMAVRQQAEVDRLQRLVDRFGAKATKAAMAHSLEKRIERIQSDAVAAPKSVASAQGEVPASRRSRVGPCSRSTRLAKSYGSLDVFDDVTFDVGRGERLLILGLNGAGKTSLLRILAGVHRRPTRARCASATTSRSATTRRSTRASRRDVRCSSTCASRSTRRYPTKTLRRLLGMFALTGEKAHQDASTLSGGEKTKLALAQLVGGRHNLLLLDEPTNNLDPGAARRDRDRARRMAGHDDHRQPRRRLRAPARRPTACCSCPRATSTTGATTCSTSSSSPRSRSIGRPTSQDTASGTA